MSADARPLPPLMKFNPFCPAPMGTTIERVKAMKPEEAIALLVYLVVRTHRNTELVLKEIERMTTSETQLVQAVTDLTTAVSANATAISAEVANLKAATQPDTDPVVTTAVSNIEAIVTQLQTATAAAQAAAAPSTGDGSSTGDTAGSDADAAAATT